MQDACDLIGGSAAFHVGSEPRASCMKHQKFPDLRLGAPFTIFGNGAQMVLKPSMPSSWVTSNIDKEIILGKLVLVLHKSGIRIEPIHRPDALPRNVITVLGRGSSVVADDGIRKCSRVAFVVA